MADEEKKVAEFHEVSPVGRAKLDPYGSTYVAVGEKFVMDAEAAKFAAALGEVEITAKNVTPPWAVKAEPTKDKK